VNCFSCASFFLSLDFSKQAEDRPAKGHFAGTRKLRELAEAAGI